MFTCAKNKGKVTRGYHVETYNFYPFVENSQPGKRILRDWGVQNLSSPPLLPIQSPSCVKALALTLSFLRFKAS